MAKMHRCKVIEMSKKFCLSNKNLLDDYVNCLVVASFWWRHRDIWSTGTFRLSSWNPSRSFRAGTKTSEHACNLNIFIPFRFHSIHVGEITTS